MTLSNAAVLFDMGGYGLYVWGSFLMTSLIMAAEPWLAARRHRRAFSEALDSQTEHS